MIWLPLLLCALFYLVLEFVLLYRGKPLLTTRIRRAYSDYPPMGFLVGLLAGLLGAHFFWCG